MFGVFNKSAFETFGNNLFEIQFSILLAKEKFD